MIPSRASLAQSLNLKRHKARFVAFWHGMAGNRLYGCLGISVLLHALLLGLLFSPNQRHTVGKSSTSTLHVRLNAHMPAAPALPAQPVLSSSSLDIPTPPPTIAEPASAAPSAPILQGLAVDEVWYDAPQLDVIAYPQTPLQEMNALDTALPVSGVRLIVDLYINELGKTQRMTLLSEDQYDVYPVIEKAFLAMTWHAAVRYGLPVKSRKRIEVCLGDCSQLPRLSGELLVPLQSTMH